MIPYETRYIKAELQSLGVRIETSEHRQGGAGPAEGNTIVLDNDVIATVPIASHFVLDSPYSVSLKDGRYFLYRSGREIMEVSFLAPPRFYARTDSHGVPCWKIALRHGRDCLATTAVQQCVYWGTDKQCKFCGIELSLENGQTIAVKTAEQLAETALFASELDGLTHVTLTTGTQINPEKGVNHIIDCVRAVKKNVNLPIHVQFEPVEGLEKLNLLKESGVDTIGIHIESFDMDILSKIAPSKASHGLEKYEQAWKTAVNLFGQNQVSSFIIAGLGEKESSVIRGSEFLADLGVYPFVLPLRPIPGSIMEGSKPPEPKRMIRIYEAIGPMLESRGLSARNSKAGCVRCGACSAVTEFENSEI